MPLQHFAHEQQADALSTLLRAEEGREQLAGRHLAQAVAGIAITDSRTRPSSRANAGTTQQSCLTDLAAVAASQKISRTYDERYRELTRKIAGPTSSPAITSTMARSTRLAYAGIQH